MNVGEWVVGYFLNFRSNGSATLQRLAAESERLDITLARATGQINNAEAAMLRYENRVQSVNARMQDLKRTQSEHIQQMAQMASGVTAYAAAAAVGFGVKSAADLQTALISAQIKAPRLSGADIRNLVMSVSGETAQDSVTIANEFTKAASAGLPQDQLRSGLFEHLAKAADVLNLSNQMDPVESISQLSQMVHLFKAYKGANVDRMLEASVKMMSVQPEALQSLITQGKYFVRDALNRGVSEDEIWRQYMLMGQTGLLRGRGGTGVENFMDILGRAANINHSDLSKRQLSAFHLLDAAGRAHGMDGMFDSQGRLRFIDEKGNMHLEAAEKYLADLRKFMNPNDFTNAVMAAFLKQGGQFANMVTDASTQDQQRENQKKWFEIASISKQFDKYINSFNGSFQRFATNFKNVVIDTFAPALPPLTKLLNALSPVLAQFDQTLRDHEWIGVAIASTVAAIGAISSALFVYLTARLAIASISIPASAARIATSLDALAANMAVDGPAIAAGGAEVAAGADAAKSGLLTLTGSIAAFILRLSAWGVLLTLKGDSGGASDAFNDILHNQTDRSRAMLDPRSPLYNREYAAWYQKQIYAGQTPGHLIRAGQNSMRDRSFNDDRQRRLGDIHIGNVTIKADTYQGGNAAGRGLIDALKNPQALVRAPGAHPALPVPP